MNLENVKFMEYRENDNLLIVEYQGGTVCNYSPVNPENYSEIVVGNCLQKVLQQNFIVGVTKPRGH